MGAMTAPVCRTPRRLTLVPDPEIRDEIQRSSASQDSQRIYPLVDAPTPGSTTWTKACKPLGLKRLGISNERATTLCASFRALPLSRCRHSICWGAGFAVDRNLSGFSPQWALTIR